MDSPVVIVAGAAVVLSKIKAGDSRGEIQAGVRVMRRVLETKRDAPDAMFRKEIGAIGFRHGAHWPGTKTCRRSGHGLAHIVGSAREDCGTYAGSLAPEEVLSTIPGVILDGDISASHKRRLIIEHRGIRVILNKAGKRKEDPHWVFHAYKLWQKNSPSSVGDTAP